MFQSAFKYRYPVLHWSRNRQVVNYARTLNTLSLQLDYYMSSQFAGIASAMTNQLYEKNGIDLKFLPICPVGHEMNSVRNNANGEGSSEVSIGSVEQNIFIPMLYKNPNLRVKSVAAMFRKTPLCLTSLKPSSDDQISQNNLEYIVGAHEDTVHLINRILSSGIDGDTKKQVCVKAIPRSKKNTLLTTGEVHAIQTYLTTEVPTLQRIVSSGGIENKVLEGLNGAKLGYSQVLFAPEEDLECNFKREIIQSFLDATFKGWEVAIGDKESAAKSVEEVRAILGLNDENNDHWDSSFSYKVESVGLCNNFVKETFQGDRYGVINPSRWNEATEWLLGEEKNVGKKNIENFGLDATIWQPSPKLLAGNELARTTLDSVRESAKKFENTYGRKPSFAVITVGSLPRYIHGDRRLEKYSNYQNSWFSKKEVGEANGFNVSEISLPECTTTDELLSQIYALKSVDGIQVMWPLPEQIDSARVYNAIKLCQDVDGAHFVGQKELAPKSYPLPPVTPAAVISLLEEYDISLKNVKVLVLGRSRIVGSPLAHMLLEKGAIVTVAHSETDPKSLESLVGSADIVISAIGSPESLESSWLQPKAKVLNIGTTFIQEQDSLVSDFKGNLETNASCFSPVPGGVGPLSVAYLFKNIVTAAWEKEKSTSNVESFWTRSSGFLSRSIHFTNYDTALAFAQEVNEMSAKMDHHANMTFTHKCTNGVDVELKFFTFEANDITEKDYKAAKYVNDILDKKQILMSDYTYNLNINSIAKFPAEPRGSSRLLTVDEDGKVSHFANFSNSFFPLAVGAHIVFNESEVVKARVSVAEIHSNKPIEMMILDVGDTIREKCNGLSLNVMLRQEGIKVGQEFSDVMSRSTVFKIVDIIGPWFEDEASNGNGTECIIECKTNDEVTLNELLERIGTVPIPPYLDREAVASDSSSYNNLYASAAGSVAAPTAGLHFSDALLKQIGSENLSFLSLHVGAGTFRPVTAKDALDHKMHSENFVVSVGEIQRIINTLRSKKRLIVVGTTTCRTLESLYWCGLKIRLNKNCSTDLKLLLEQDEWKTLKQTASTVSAADALQSVVDSRKGNEIIEGQTKLMIVPGSYDFKVVNELVTNFHAPDSTLMLLVSAFLNSGEKVKNIYEEAQNLGYRFLSYGDVCYFRGTKK